MGAWLDTPDWVDELRNSEQVQEFLLRPRGFVLGVILSTLLGGIETILLTVLDGIVLVFYGSSRATTGGQYLGIADIPLLLGELAIAVGSTIGGSAGTGSSDPSGLLGLARLIMNGLLSVASSAGPLAPVALAVIVAGLSIASVIVIRRAALIVVDAIPGGGGLV